MKFFPNIRTVVVVVLFSIVLGGCGIPDNQSIQERSWLKRVLTRCFCLTWYSQIGDPYGLTLFEFDSSNETSEPEDENRSEKVKKLEQLTTWQTQVLRPEHRLTIKSVKADYVGHKLAQVRFEYNNPTRQNADRMAKELKSYFQLQPDSYDEINREATDEKSALYTLEFVGKPNPESWGQLYWEEKTGKEPEMRFCWRGTLPKVPEHLRNELLPKIRELLDKDLKLEYPEPVFASWTFNGYRMGQPGVVDLVLSVISRGPDDAPMTTRWGIRFKFDSESGEFKLDDTVNLMEDELSYERASLRKTGNESSWSATKLTFCEPRSPKNDDESLPEFTPPQPAPPEPQEPKETPIKDKTRDLFELNAFGIGTDIGNVRRNGLLSEHATEQMNWHILDLKPERPDIKSEVALFMNSDTVNGMEVVYERLGMTKQDVVDTLVNDYSLSGSDYYISDDLILFQNAPDDGCCGSFLFENDEIVCYVRKGEPVVPKEIRREVYNAVIDRLYEKLPPKANIHKYDETGTDFRFGCLAMRRDQNIIEVRLTAGIQGKFQNWCFVAEYENNELVEPRFYDKAYEDEHLVQLNRDEKCFQQAKLRRDATPEEQNEADFKKMLGFLGL